MVQQTAPQWVQVEEGGPRYLALVEKPVQAMGTDPTMAINFATRRADLSTFGLGSGVTVAQALEVVTTRVAEKWFERDVTAPSRRSALLGGRPNRVRDRVNGEPVYRARPLDGVWATAPYLHNGSVPNLWELLSPETQRSKVFCVGSREFDSLKVGLDPSCRTGATTEIDTAREGNWNTGHEFKGDGSIRRDGVLGRGLTDEERYELIEFLKTL